MQSLKLKSMWKIMTENRFDVPPEFTNEDLFCVICKKLVTDAFVSGVCGCNYCHNCILEYLNNEEKYCPGGKEDCYDKYLALGSNVIRNDMLNKIISNLKVNCPNQPCTFNTELMKMAEHLRLCKKESMDCPYATIGCNIEKVDIDKINSHMHNEAVPHSELLIELIHNLRNEVNELRVKSERDSWIYNDKIAMLEDDLSNVRNEMENRENERIRIDETARRGRVALASMVTDFRKDVDGMEEGSPKSEWKREEKMDKICPNIVGDFRWKIEQLSTKIDIHLFSESFYSNNYKFCLYLRIWMDDNIYLYCYIMKGDNDDMVDWPMRRLVTLSIVNQVTMTAYKTETYQYDTFEEDKRAFDRPLKHRNYLGIGSYWSSSFIKFSSIKAKPSIFVDDSIVVSCAVSDH